MSIRDRIKKLRSQVKYSKFGELASLPASYIDSLDLESNSSFFSKAINYLKREAIYLVFFLPTLLVDFVSTSFATIAFGISFAFAKLFGLTNLKEYSYEKYNTYFDMSIKNGLGLLGAFFGLYSPKLVSFFYIPEAHQSNSLVSGGKLYEAEVELIKIDNSEQLCQVIKKAQQDNVKLTVRGAGFSQGCQFLPAGETDSKQSNIVVDLSLMNEVNIHDNKTATVGAGTTWAQLQTAANTKKLAVKVMQASNVFSIGGSIGTNIHGWDHQSGTLSQTINSVTVVNAQGEVNTYQKGSQEFANVFGGLGMMGIVTSVEIQLTDNEVLLEKAVKLTPSDYVPYFQNEVLKDDNTRLHYYWLSLTPENFLQEGIAINYVRKDPNNIVGVETTNLFHEEKRGTRFERVAINFVRRNRNLQGGFWTNESQRILNQSDEQATTTTNDVMHPAINAMFNPSSSEAEWLQEYFVPGESLDEFLKGLAEILNSNNVQMINATVRYVKQDDISPLPYAPNNRFAVVICFNQELKPAAIEQTKLWVRQTNDLVIKNQGSFYLPYQQFASQEQFINSYGADRIERFQELKAQADPKNLFATGFYSQYIAEQPKLQQENFFKLMMSDESFKKSFKGFLEVVLQRMDSDKFFELLEKIIPLCDNHQQTYEMLSEKIGDIMPGFIGDLSNIFSSLKNIKNDLVSQAKILMPNKTEIDGMVEIGYPGRFINEFKNQFNVTGEITAVLESESLTDYIQFGGVSRPYNNFVALDYKKPDLKSIKSSSVEVVTCFVGLHHFPVNELDQFLENVKRILKPGGKFLLVDHDIQNESDMLMAQLAHSTFNVATGVTVADELNEFRNFQPMEYWQEKLAEHGLDGQMSELDVEATIRTNDPSRNRMMSFQKAPVLQALHTHTSSPDVAEEESVILENNPTNKQGKTVTPAQAVSQSLPFLNKENEVADPAAETLSPANSTFNS